MPETNEETTVESKETTEEVESTESDTKLEELQGELTKRDETIGSLKRELKDAKKPKEDTTSKTEKKEEKTDEFGLLELTYLKGEEVKSDDEVEFVREQLKELNLTKDQLPKLFSNKYFQSELETFRTEKVNKDATSDVKGGASEGKAVNTPEYWIAKGVPPTREQVPDRKTRAKIAKAMIANTKSSKMFYSD